ncbi:MAG: transcription termination factor Rho [Lachnospiraceae bacterium]|nr:transcription termination factor Rho [Lachnospiraceae bacterium]
MNYEKMSVSELKELAKEKGLKGVTALKKAELIEALSAAEKKEAPAAAEKREKPKKEARTEKKPEVKQEVNAEPKPEVKPEVKPEAKPEIKSEAKPEIRERAERPYQPQQQRNNQNYQNNSNNQNNNRPNNPNNQRNQFRPGQRPQYGQPRQMRDNSEQPRQMREASDGRAQREYSENPKAAQENNESVPAPAVHAAPNNYAPAQAHLEPANVQEGSELDSGIEKHGILEIMPDGFGFIRCDNFLPGMNDVYVSPMQIKRYGLRNGDMIRGNTKVQAATEKFSALLYIKDVNGYTIEETLRRRKFETLTPIFPKERIHMETPSSSVAMRMVDLIAPIGKGQRGMIVSQPKSGKTTLLKEIANSITKNHPDMHLIILLIDERPEEVTDMKESIHGAHVDVIYSTFDELPENHKRVSEMVIERAKRLVEYGKDVVILLDSITRLARAYNLTVTASGRTLSGGLDPAALHMPKKFFGAARTMREGGSLTILATALVETGSRMDDVVFEEFKGTGNMELVLDRNLSERRIFPAIDLAKSGTRRDDLLLAPDELEAMSRVRRALNGAHPEETTEKLINMCAHTRNNRDFVNTILKGIN